MVSSECFRKLSCIAWLGVIAGFWRKRHESLRRYLDTVCSVQSMHQIGRHLCVQNIVARFRDWLDTKIYIFVGSRSSDGDDDTIASIPNMICVIAHGD